MEEGVPPSRVRSGVFVLGVGILEFCLGGGVLAGEDDKLGVFPDKIGMLPGMVGVVRSGIPDGFDLE